MTAFRRTLLAVAFAMSAMILTACSQPGGGSSPGSQGSAGLASPSAAQESTGY
ncbi:MAG TPA: hypothetical protein VGQ47_00750 [Candidatus Limnocylindrales bacterium]|jgi:hypothetical protein|nr:hypothetical protein [Candidatus Limnocylindrales bacterium]